MNFTLEQIIDIPLLQSLQDKLNAINCFPSALIDNTGKILTATAWQDICTKFHRVHPVSEKECILSDQYILSHLPEAKPAVSYTCPHGMVDNATPIIVEGLHLANFFTGQLFLEQPDIEWFRKQSVLYGFSEADYIDAVKKVPVWTREQLDHYLDYIKTFTESMALMGLTRLRKAEALRLAQESETKYQTQVENASRFRRVVENTLAGYFFIDSNGIIRDVNDSWVRLYKYNDRNEILGHHFADIQKIEDTGLAMETVNRIMAGDPASMTGDFSRKCKDGTIGYHNFSARPVYSSDTVIGIEGFILDTTDQKNAELERDTTKIRFKSLFDKMIEGFALHEIICDESGRPIDYRFLELNPAFEERTGLKASVAIGKTAREMIPDLEPFWIERYGKVALSGEPVTFTEYSEPLGKYFRVEAFSNKRGQFATIFDDITERVASEKELRDSENKYRQLADLTPEGILVHIDGVIVYANNSAARIFGGSSPDDIQGRKVMDFVMQEYQQVVSDRIRTITDKKDFVPKIEEKLRRLDGEVFYSEVSAVPFSMGSRNAVQVVFNDITTRKADEEKLRTLAAAIDSIKECVSMTDPENNLIFVNKAFCSTYGYTPDELLGRNIQMVRSLDEEGAALGHILTETLGGGWSGEAVNRRKDGTEFPVHISTAVVPDKDDNPIALIGVAVDITERKKTEQELIAAKQKAEESDRLKSAFLANISHEIRTPMNSILGFSELLEEITDDPTQQAYLKIISSGGERLLNIINSVIDLAKIESGQENYVPVEFDANSLLLELYDLNKRRNNAIRFINDMAGKPSILLFTDKTKLFQILNNLLTNALKYTKKGFVRFGYTLDVNTITFYVRDSGIGIPEAFRTKVFERFRKVDLDDRADFEGTGLGLAISKELVRILNGKIWFEPGKDSGTTFFVSLPL